MTESTPTDHDPTDLWRAIVGMSRESVEIPFPRRGSKGEAIGTLRMVVLTQQEQMISIVAATKFARSRMREEPEDGVPFQSLYAHALCIEVLQRACRDADNVNRLAFPPADLLRKQLTIDDCAQLIERYKSVVAELGAASNRPVTEKPEA